MTSIALALGLLAVTADYPPGTIGSSSMQPRHEFIRAPLPGSSTTTTPSTTGQSNYGVPGQSSASGGECNQCNDGSCDDCKGHRRRQARCNMLPHYAYISDWDFYYYFRPYNYIHVRPQQEIVTRWGGDVRNPYANEMFEKVYEGLEDSFRAGVKKTEPVMPVPISDRRKPQARMPLGPVGGFSK